jgi:2,4-dienoyl-CoA reductase (NADPH2)
MKGVRMLSGVVYERIDAAGLYISYGPDRERPELVACDTVVLCAGQVSDRSLADDLSRRGVTAHVIGGADVASELDAKRAIAQAARLAASI